MKFDHLSITFSDVGLSRGKVGSKSQPVFVLFAGSCHCHLSVDCWEAICNTADSNNSIVVILMFA